MNNSIFFALFLLLTSLPACKDEEPRCPDNHLPIIMVHGALAAGDTYAPFSQRMLANGYCEDHLFAFDWNTLASGSSVAQLDSFIREALLQTGKEQVYLMGHSAGGNLGYQYLADSARASRVSKYIHIGSNAQSSPPGPNGDVPVLNIWSSSDAVVNSSDIPGAENLDLLDQDHYQVATSPESFSAIFKFLLGKDPETTIIPSERNIEIAGRVLTLGENMPVPGAMVKLYTLGNDGQRLAGIEAIDILPDENGDWGPLKVDPDTHYEFEVTSSDPGFRKVHYYREPFSSSNDLVYLRVFPPASSFVGILLSTIPSNDDQAVITVFSSSRAVINGRDELYIGDNELSTGNFTRPDQSTIAMFLYDNGDGQTSLTAFNQFLLFPFLKAVDVFTPTENVESVPLRFNGRTLNVRNWKSASEGLSIAVFD